MDQRWRGEWEKRKGRRGAEGRTAQRRREVEFLKRERREAPPKEMKWAWFSR